MRPKAFACLEIGWLQAADVSAILLASGFDGPKTHRDLAGRDRVVSVEIG
jgi:methylase of polypeptide subunit release factors